MAVCAEGAGIARKLVDGTVEYTKQRKQFGQPISKFQVLQHRMSDMFCEMEQIASMALMGTLKLDEAPSARMAAVSLAKAKASEVAELATNEAIQMHGGMGMTDAFDMGFFMKRARVLQELFGDSNFHLNQLAQSRGY